jgi:predicted Rossmann fold flavoprotein
MSKKLIVIGGGAAGFFCAVTAARLQPGLQVTLVEKSGKVLSKVKVSGGGRCNVTHACFDITEMSRNYPRGNNFVKKAFHNFFTTDTIRWFEERGVVLKKEEDGRMFPVTDSSQTIIDCLVRELNKHKVEMLLHAEVKRINKASDIFSVELNDGRKLTSDFLCIASGGYPKSAQFDWIKSTGHSIEEPVPSLFTFNIPQHPVTVLMGVTIPHTKVKVAGTKLEQSGPLLITHWGLSGPAVLKLSAWGARILAEKSYEFTILVNWLPSFNEQKLNEHIQQNRIEAGAQKLSGRNNLGLPQRLWEYMIDQSAISKEKRWADLSHKEQLQLVRLILASEFQVKGKTTYKEEFVTSGGIRLNEIDHHTMMSKKSGGLFFAGEVMDVDGITGGFNFQHAWTSGYIAGKSIAELAS